MVRGLELSQNLTWVVAFCDLALQVIHRFSTFSEDRTVKLLETVELVKVYNKRPVVNKVSFEVNAGEIVGLLGRNGAGKTTSFRMAIGLVTPDNGRVFFNGEDVTHLPMYMRARRGMGYLAQEPSIFRNLTVQQNILAVLEARKLDREERKKHCADLIADLGLGKVINSLAVSLSGGERRRLEISRSLATEPSLILLDEPFSGIDPIAVQEIRNIVKNLRDRGMGILITDHNVRETLSITNRSYIIDEGRVLRQGTAEELVNDPVVRKTYLGDSFTMEEFAQARRGDRPKPGAVRRLAGYVWNKVAGSEDTTEAKEAPAKPKTPQPVQADKPPKDSGLEL